MGSYRRSTPWSLRGPEVLPSEPAGGTTAAGLGFTQCRIYGEALRSKNVNFEKNDKLIGLSHLVTGPGRVPTLGNVSFRGHQLHSWRLNLNFVSVERGGEHVPCLQSSQNRWRLECGDVTADWETKNFQLLHGMAFRWHVMFHSPVRQLQISAWLPSAAVEGQVDGSPVVARHRKEMARLVASYTASSSFPGKGPERLLDDDTETEWFAGKGEQDAWILLDLEGERVITSISWIWWAKSADEWILESRKQESEPWLRRSSNTEVIASSDFNGEVLVKGWDTPTRWLRLTMSKGHLDPWNFGVLFGLRSFAVLGRNDAATAGTSRVCRSQPLAQSDL
eukprot:symbB.v1.2.026909.t2/scaffold2726.1/size72210/7